MEITSDTAAYAGIGSRSSPPAVLGLMNRIARMLALKGFALRTGGAEGADEAFITGALSAPTHRLCVELYVPWRGFGRSFEYGAGVEVFEPHSEAYIIAEQYHPQWSKLTDGVRKLHARNVHQILGRNVSNLATRSAFVLCWTPDGATTTTTRETGGTGQAIRIAHAYEVSVWNLAREDHYAKWVQMLNQETT